LSQGRYKTNHREDREEIGRRLIFCNVAGIERQNKDFWKNIIGYEYIGLSKTWLEEKEWDRIKEKLPTHIWEALHAERKNKKSRRGVVY